MEWSGNVERERGNELGEWNGKVKKRSEAERGVPCGGGGGVSLVGRSVGGLSLPL